MCEGRERECCLCQLRGSGASHHGAEHLVTNQCFLTVCFARCQAGDAGGLGPQEMTVELKMPARHPRRDARCPQNLSLSPWPAGLSG